MGQGNQYNYLADTQNLFTRIVNLLKRGQYNELTFVQPHLIDLLDICHHANVQQDPTIVRKAPEVFNQTRSFLTFSRYLAPSVNIVAC